MLPLKAGAYNVITLARLWLEDLVHGYQCCDVLAVTLANMIMLLISSQITLKA